jgi:hypothetical protein
MAEKFYHPDVPADLAPMFEKLADALSDALALIVDPSNDHGGDVYNYILIGMAAFFTITPLDETTIRGLSVRFYQELKDSMNQKSKDTMQ